MTSAKNNEQIKNEITNIEKLEQRKEQFYEMLNLQQTDILDSEVNELF